MGQRVARNFCIENCNLKITLSWKVQEALPWNVSYHSYLFVSQFQLEFLQQFLCFAWDPAYYAGSRIVLHNPTKSVKSRPTFCVQTSFPANTNWVLTDESFETRNLSWLRRFWLSTKKISRLHFRITRSNIQFGRAMASLWMWSISSPNAREEPGSDFAPSKSTKDQDL